MLTKRRRDHPLVLLGRLLLGVHARLGLLRRRLSRLLLLIHHVLLLLRLQMLVLGLLLRMLGLLRLHVRVLGVHLVVHLGVDERRAVRSIEDAALMIDRGRLKLATSINNRSGRMSVGGGGVSHMSHATVWGRRSVAGHAVHATVLLLVLIVRRVSHVHTIVRREPRVRHVLLGTRRSPIVVGRYSLP